MINYLKGNLFESDAEALVNTVNTVGVMGKGLALQFKETFPENFRIYRDICRKGQLHTGEMLVTEDSSLLTGHKIIINFPTKKHWRLPSEYYYIEQGLDALRLEIEKRGIKSIAIPPLGSHNGGLDWQRVKVMIEEKLDSLNCDIYIYEPSDIIIQKMRTERVRLTPARALLILMFGDMINEGEFASVFAAEKLIYFMQRFGGKNIFKLDYKPYFYGPYSGGKVAHVLYHLNGSYLKGMSGMDNRPFDYIWLTEDAVKDARTFVDNNCDSSIWNLYNRTTAFLKGFYSNYSLELLSSVDYLLENSSSLKGWQSKDESLVIDTLIQELKSWSHRKEQMFQPKFLSMAIHHLRDIGI